MAKPGTNKLCVLGDVQYSERYSGDLLNLINLSVEEQAQAWKKKPQTEFGACSRSIKA